MPIQEAFHACTTPERILRGSNRSGKTSAASVEIARAVLNKDPHHKFPERDGHCYIIGPSEKHIHTVLWPKLTGSPWFIIRDLQSGLWRPWQPNNPSDVERRRERRRGPPLIPDRMIQGGQKGIAWKSRKLNLPEHVPLVTGWDITFFTSGTRPPKGSAVHLVWFDEDFEDEGWYGEMAARLSEHNGQFIWSATPEAGSATLFELSERAAREEKKEEPLTKEFFMHIDDNTFMSDKAKKTFISKIFDPDVARVKIGGEFSVGLSKIYHEFNQISHCVPPREKWPRHWTYYTYTDPGHQICAVLFVAVPPPKEEHAIYIYDELYMSQCNANMFGREMRHKTMGKVFQNFTIDTKGSGLSDIGSGLTIREQYAQALARFRVESVESGCGFSLSVVDVDAGIERVRELLRPRDETGIPTLRVVYDPETKAGCANFIEEIKRYRYKLEKGKMVGKPKPESRGRVHLMATLAYMALANPQWVKPTSRKKRLSPAVLAFRAKQQREKDRRGRQVAFLGAASDIDYGG